MLLLAKPYGCVIVVLMLGIGCRTNESPEQQVNDDKIMASVKSKLAQELGPSTMTNISVNVTNGVVTLAGTVHNSEEKSKAVAIAQGVPNVIHVNDNLQIPPTPTGQGPP
jgi:osmotically-inducible protein OsmY